MARKIEVVRDKNSRQPKEKPQPVTKLHPTEIMLQELLLELDITFLPLDQRKMNHTRLAEILGRDLSSDEITNWSRYQKNLRRRIGRSSTVDRDKPKKRIDFFPVELNDEELVTNILLCLKSKTDDDDLDYGIRMIGRTFYQLSIEQLLTMETRISGLKTDKLFTKKIKEITLHCVLIEMVTRPLSTHVRAELRIKSATTNAVNEVQDLVKSGLLSPLEKSHLYKLIYVLNPDYAEISANEKKLLLDFIKNN